VIQRASVLVRSQCAGNYPVFANNLANMPIRNSGDCGTVSASVEAEPAPQARPGPSENRGVVSSILTLATTSPALRMVLMARS